MNNEEYLKLFGNRGQEENLNETTQSPWENLQRQQQNQWENLNETPNLDQYNINENLNDGWGTLDIQVETRVNGVPQTQQNQQHLTPNSRRHKGQNLNGLDAFIGAEEDLREVKQTVSQGPAEMMAPPIVENVQDADVVSVQMFENMNSNALLTLANRKISNMDTSKITNNQEDRQVRFLNS